jgi:hypothetical protein
MGKPAAYSRISASVSPSADNSSNSAEQPLLTAVRVERRSSRVQRLTSQTFESHVLVGGIIEPLVKIAGISGASIQVLAGEEANDLMQPLYVGISKEIFYKCIHFLAHPEIL